MSCVVEYPSLACTGTGQATFDNTSEEQVAALPPTRTHRAAATDPQ